MKIKSFFFMSILIASCQVHAVAINAQGTGMTENSACAEAKKGLELKTRGTVLSYGSCSCDKNGVMWTCYVDGDASK